MDNIADEITKKALTDIQQTIKNKDKIIRNLLICLVIVIVGSVGTNGLMYYKLRQAEFDFQCMNEVDTSHVQEIEKLNKQLEQLKSNLPEVKANKNGQRSIDWANLPDAPARRNSYDYVPYRGTYPSNTVYIRDEKPRQEVSVTDELRQMDQDKLQHDMNRLKTEMNLRELSHPSRVYPLFP